MTQIRFFAQYRMWKAFVFWRKFIRSKKTAKCQAVLQESLLILSPNLREPLLKLREILFEVGLWDLYHVSRPRTFFNRHSLENLVSRNHFLLWFRRVSLAILF
jgi:hypothetical protein